MFTVASFLEQEDPFLSILRYANGGGGGGACSVCPVVLCLVVPDKDPQWLPVLLHKKLPATRHSCYSRFSLGPLEKDEFGS